MLLYIRGGSIFARKDTPRRSSKAMVFDPMTLVIALDLDGEAQGSLYVDDGDSFDYKEKGVFARIEFVAHLQGTENVLNLVVNVTGNAKLLNAESLKINQIILIQASGHVQLPVDLYLGENFTQQLDLQK